MTSSLRVGVAGATGALGKELLSVLEQAPWSPEEVVPYASAGTSIQFVTYRDHQVAVEDLDTLDAAMLDALILAVPREVAKEAGAEAMRTGIPVVDLSGALASRERPFVIPWVNPEELGGAGPEGVVCVPSAGSLLMASTLGSLVRSGLVEEIHGMVMLGASAWGRSGVGELSQQVVSLFNQGVPSRKIFPQGLAFDILPAVGAIGSDGWTDVERRVVAESRALLRWPGVMDVGVVGVPVFSGVCAEIRLRCRDGVSDEGIRRVLADGGVRVSESVDPRELPRQRRVEGDSFAHVGRLRTGGDPRDRILWSVMDNLRGGATVAVAACAALLRGTGKLADSDAQRAPR